MATDSPAVGYLRDYPERMPSAFEGRVQSKGLDGR